MSSDRDDARDAYLQRALRHAPDADLTPPLELSAAILREARDATAPQSSGAAAERSTHAAPARRAPNTASASSWSAWWTWLAQPRIATGFACLMVATLAGLMWWNQPLEPVFDRPPAASPSPAVAKAEAGDRQVAGQTTAQTAEPAAGKTMERAVERPIDASSTGQPAPPASPAPSRELVKRRAEAKASTATGQRELGARHDTVVVPAEVSAAEPAPKAAAAGAAPPLHGPGPPASQDTLAGIAAAPLAPPAAAPNVARPAERAAPDAARERVAAAAAAGAAPTRRVEADIGRSALNLRSASRLAQSPAADAFTRERSEMVSVPSRWQWQWGRSAPRAVDDALQQWLARVDAAVGAAWVIDAEAGASTLAVSPAAEPSSLVLLRDGAQHSRLQLEPDGVRFVRLDGTVRALRAALPAAAMVELRESIEALTR